MLLNREGVNEVEIRRGLVGIVVGLTLVGMGSGCGDTTPDEEETAQARELGASLFAEVCSDCHGLDARGEGPIAKGLTSTPADLTRISERRGGRFPLEEMRQIVDGRSLAGHRGFEMPKWGDFFENDPEAKIEALVRYLESIQQMEASSPEADTPE